MRLVFLSHAHQNNGGAQKCLVSLLKGLKSRYPEIELYVIFPHRRGGLLEDCLPYIDGHCVVRISSWLVRRDKAATLFSKAFFVCKIVKSALLIGRYLRKIKPDYAITNTIVVPHLAWACRFSSVKHIWFVHEVPLAWSDLRFVFSDEKIFQSLDRLSDKILLPSGFARSFYAQFVPQEKLYVIDQSVEVGSTDTPIAEPRPPHDRYTVLLMGSFDSNKGQLELLSAVKQILSQGRDIICYMVGAGSISKCESYVKDNNLDDHVKIEPFSANVRRYYNLADVLVVCSGLETFCRVAVEAQMCGLPVILSDVGANSERVDNGITGLLYEKGNIEDLIGKIETLRDENVRKEFVSRICSSDFSRYNVDSFADQFYGSLK